MKKNFFPLVLLSILSLLSACSQANNLQSQIQRGLDKIISQINFPINLGILVLSPNSTVYYNRNGSQLFVPASNLKLFTGAAALLYLGPQFTFQTTLATTDIERYTHTINGDMYLKFTGDPDLTIVDLENLIAVLQEKKITMIRGNFYLDTSQMNGQNYASGWMWDDLNSCYAAPINSIMLDHNCFNFGVVANKKIDTKANLALLPKYYQFTPVINNIITVANSQNCGISIDYLQKNSYQLNGCLPQNNKMQDVKIAIHNSNLFATMVISSLLQKDHIQLTGKIISGIMPKDAAILAIHKSRPLSELVKQMLKNSDNQIANVLFKTLGGIYYHQSGNWQNGSMALKSILTKTININFNHSNIVDGAGISRYNLVTPQQTEQLLVYMEHDKKLTKAFIASLPISGMDGTLQNRMKNKAAQGQINAKTGTMTGISSLSGFVSTKHHGRLIFIIFSNNFTVPIRRVTALEDTICEYLANL